MKGKRVRVTWRKAGGVKPANVVYCGRPSVFGNPFKVGEWSKVDGQTRCLTPGLSVRLFRGYACERMTREPNWLDPLRGKDLACWCKEGEPCHVDVLLELLEAGE